MKTSKKIFAVMIAVLFAGTSAIASGNLKLNIMGTGNDRADVEISNVKISTFEIEVTNEFGERVFYKETKAPSNTYKKKYDFSQLEDGTYFFTVKVDNESTESKLDIKNGEVKILEEKKMVDPVFIFDNKQLKMSYLNFGEKSTTLTVYDSKRNEVYSKDLKSNFITQHGLDFSNVNRGRYQVVLSNINEVHSYEVLID